MKYSIFKKFTLILSSLLILGTLAVHMFDSDFAGKLTQEDNSELIAQGKALYQKRGCLSCHGNSGATPSDESYPNLAGQPRVYLEQQIKDIRDGRRSNGSSSLMKSSVQRTSDRDAYLIALYLSLE